MRNFSWLLRMAVRDSRRYRSRLLLFMSSILLGTAALVAIQSLSVSLEGTVEAESKTLLGADLYLGGRSLPDSTLKAAMDSVPGMRIRRASFNNMVHFPKQNGTKLARIRAQQPGYPFYGEWDVLPKGAEAKIWQGPYAVVDEAMLAQFGVEVGDSVEIGAATFVIAGRLQSISGESAAQGLTAPRVYIAFDALNETQLIQFGSRVYYSYWYKTPTSFDPEAWRKAHEGLADSLRYDIDTIETRKRGVDRVLGNLFSFFNLVGFVALLLGSVGVASAVNVYVRQRVSTVAILRCVGATSGQATAIYVIQVLLAGLVGSLLGVALGIGLQLLWPYLLADFLPVEVDFILSARAILVGFGVGISFCLLFALLPLVRIRRISPLVALRNQIASLPSGRDSLRLGLIVLLVVSLLGFAMLLSGSVVSGVVYTLGLGVVFVLLVYTARGLMLLARRFFPVSWGYVWRQGLANLFRPNNQTLVLIVVVGLGTFLISTLFLVQENLLQQVDFRTQREDAANILLLDVQSNQVDSVQAIIREQGLPVLESAPIVSVRIAEVRGRTFLELRNDSTLDIPFWAGEARVTYRDSLLDTEEVIEGSFQANAPQGSKPRISIGPQTQEMWQLEIGDEVVFDVQGVRIATVVGSVREIDLLAARPNFQWVFPAGVLEEAPQFHLVFSRAPNAQASAALQSALFQAFPSVTAVDISAALDTFQDILDRVSLVVEFLALFSILTGIVVLLGAMLSSRGQRIQENVLLRTLGAQGGQLYRILAIEYVLLGLVAALTGLVLAVVAAWALAAFAFDNAFTPGWQIPLAGLALVIGTITLLGMSGSLRLVRTSPLVILRQQ